jgi:hypothetical protein
MDPPRLDDADGGGWTEYLPAENAQQGDGSNEEHGGGGALAGAALVANRLLCASVAGSSIYYFPLSSFGGNSRYLSDIYPIELSQRLAPSSLTHATRGGREES